MQRRILAALAALPLLSAIPASHAVAASVPLPTLGTAKDVVVQSDGKILAAFQSNLGDRFTVVRLLPGLTPDPTFGGGDGIAETIIEPTRKSTINDLALQPDGRILAAGHVFQDVNDSTFVIVRYQTDGSLDPTFGGGDGEVITDFVTRNGASPRIALATDGGIVAAGTDTTYAGIVLARYRADGSADPTFGTAGTTVIDLAETTESANDLAIDAAGNVLVGGNVHVPFHNPQHLLARITSAGQLDPTFGSGGLVTWEPAPGEGAVRSVVVLSDGRIVTGGSASYGTVKTLARYLPSGQPDPSFGDGGFVTTNVGGLFLSGDRADGDVVVLHDGRVALGETVYVPTPHVRIAVYRPDGTPDPAFDGDDGVVELPLGVPDKDDSGGFLALTRGGAIVVAGTDVTGSHGNGTLEVLAVPSLVPAADLSAVITATPNPAPAGPVELQVHVRNDGPRPATGVGLTFELSQAIGEVHPAQGSCHAVLSHKEACSLGTIAPGGDVVVTFGTHVNGFEEGLFGTATVGSSVYDPDPSDNAVTAEVLIDGGITS
jgi:uncharacterized delta-60 repeat protein